MISGRFNHHLHQMQKKAVETVCHQSRLLSLVERLATQLADIQLELSTLKNQALLQSRLPSGDATTDIPLLQQHTDDSLHFSQCLPSAPPPVRGILQRPVHVFYDFETTGLGKTQDIRIAEIGAVHVSPFDGEVLGQFRALVNPNVRMSQDAENINGLTSSKLQHCPQWKTIGQQFNDWLESLRSSHPDQAIILSAHNGKRFDSRILVFEHYRHHLQLPSHLYHADTIPFFKLSLKLDSYSLNNIYKHVFGHRVPNAHTALGDVKAMAKLFEWVVVTQDEGEIVHTWCHRHQESFDVIEKRCLRK